MKKVKAFFLLFRMAVYMWLSSKGFHADFMQFIDFDMIAFVFRWGFLRKSRIEKHHRIPKTILVNDLDSACVMFEEECEEMGIRTIARIKIKNGMSYSVKLGRFNSAANVYFGRNGMRVIVYGADNPCKQILVDRMQIYDESF